MKFTLKQSFLSTHQNDVCFFAFIVYLHNFLILTQNLHSIY
ncbi:Uncharacterised protein [Staphylococcus agnetis]|nr:Uncharacterised protein [Staphylococcus agnetis]